MTTISIQIDDQTKSEAEKIAKEIGIPLNTVINIFLKSFIENHGFPFSVVSTDNTEQVPIIDINVLDESVKRAINKSRWLLDLWLQLF